MDYSLDWLGYLGGFLIVISLIPQAVKSYQTRSTRDISKKTYLIYLSGTGLYFLYSIYISNGPMMLTNGAALLLGGFVLHLKLKYG